MHVDLYCCGLDTADQSLHCPPGTDDKFVHHKMAHLHQVWNITHMRRGGGWVAIVWRCWTRDTALYSHHKLFFLSSGDIKIAACGTLVMFLWAQTIESCGKKASKLYWNDAHAPQWMVKVHPSMYKLLIFSVLVTHCFNVTARITTTKDFYKYQPE